jgi:alkylhydroperoxidase family enzyme
MAGAGGTAEAVRDWVGAWEEFRDTMTSAARIGPGGRREIGVVNTALAGLIGLAAGGPPPNLFTTLARHRPLYRKWLRFAGALMPGGLLPRTHSELLILRTAHNCDCEYEWRHHERLGRQAGLRASEIEAVREGPSPERLAPHQQLLLAAADELHHTHRISDEVWASLRADYGEAQLIELCMLVGHYQMLAMTINALAIELDPPPTRRPPRAIRVVQGALTHTRDTHTSTTN